MVRTKRLITALSGHRGNSCYICLCYAVYIACTCQPNEPSMQAICQRVADLTGSTAQAVSKSLSRAVTDIWNNGDRTLLAEICGHSFIEKPSPKDIICILAQYLWVENTSA